MIRILLLPLLALGGAAFAILTVAAGSQPAPIGKPVADPSRPPFETYIAGSGILEAMDRNVAIGAPLARLVLEVSVKVGDDVDAGAPLFRLDDRDARAEFAVRKAAAGASKAQLDRLKSALLLLKAGSWKADIQVAEADLASAEAQMAQTETEISRLTVRAPAKGSILQVNVRAGEFAPAGALQNPLMLFGPLERFHLRVDVDENDAWRFKKDAAAVAFVRGNRDLKTELKFERVEPYVIPKRSLTGDSTERVDTRVMQAVYSFDRHKLPVYVGQQMDVFIEVKNGAKP